MSVVNANRFDGAAVFWMLHELWNSRVCQNSVHHIHPAITGMRCVKDQQVCLPYHAIALCLLRLPCLLSFPFYL